jgi:hypothetical protein
MRITFVQMRLQHLINSNINCLFVITYIYWNVNTLIYTKLRTYKSVRY